MTIKMKDMLALPVKRVAGGVMPFLKDGNGEVMFVGSRYHVDLCVTAINAYDANQERMVELQKLVDHWICNHNNVVAQLRVFTSRPDITINKQQEEIKALKAHAEELTSALTKGVSAIPLAGESAYQDEIRHIMINALDKTPQQCLASVKAESFNDGVISMGCELVNEHESNFPGGEVQICAIVQVVIDTNKGE